MPEGDTIYRAAKTLHAALAGRVVTRFESVFPKLLRVEVTGRTVERVVSAGKNLIMDFSGDLHLRTHMRMHGSWHIYRPGERWRKPFSDMRIILETAEYVAVAFNVPVAEFHDAPSLARQDDLRNIGPDFLGDDFDFEEAHRRVRAHDDEEIADVLLNQRVAAGVGNEYKSEILFICRVNPFERTGRLDDATVDHLLRVSRKLMLANIAKRTPGRETTFSLDKSQKVYVYGRGGKPCRRCGTPIAFARQGRHARVTYWCPKCQHALQ